MAHESLGCCSVSQPKPLHSENDLGIQREPFVTLPFTANGGPCAESEADLGGDWGPVVGNEGAEDDLWSQLVRRTTTLTALLSERVLLDDEEDWDDCMSVQSRSSCCPAAALLAALDEEFSSLSSMSDIHTFDDIATGCWPVLFRRYGDRVGEKGTG